ncbi:MAG: helix-turn-helix transcriptional regulator [Oscillospiraceae bacterium]|nr:helix-turn-helix transcriptional regulator [Oscillospiraceae bacterium]
MRLKEIRKSKNISQEQAANSLGISVRAYQNYEYEQREPNIEMINKLADFYGVTTDYLLGREPLPNPLAACEKDEAAVIEKYLSLPSEARKCTLNVLRQLGETAQSFPQDNKK